MPRVLYVEDDALLRMVTTIALEDAGYAVVEAHDGHQARRLLDEEGGFDFVISDISMPGSMSGVEAAQAAQAGRTGCRTIRGCGYATAQLPPLPVWGVELGKPFRVQQLIGSLAGATGSPA